MVESTGLSYNIYHMPEEINQKNEKEMVEKEPKIHTMPERFLGVEPGLKPIEKVADTTAPIKKKFPLMPVIIIGAVVLVFSGGIASYYIFLKPKPPIQVVEEEPTAISPSISEEEELEEAATPTPEEPEEEEEEPEIVLDTDGDGLTDVEEKVYGSDINNPDTDGDGHLDGHEVFHLYNPMGETPLKLLETGAVKEYKNSQLGYKIYSPTPWSTQVIDEVMGTVMFSSGTGEFIEVLVEENKQKLPIISWYLSQAPGVRAGELGTFVTKGNLDGIKSPDRLTAYFTKNGLVYIISYNIGSKKDVYYRRTFEMMLNSFEVR